MNQENAKEALTMSRNPTPKNKARLIISSLLFFVISFLHSSANAMAQTTTNSKGFLAGLISVRASAVKVAFTYGPNYPTAGQTVQFVDASTGSPISWDWDFGDGSTSTAQNPSHIYSTPGFRKVTLVATNNVGTRKAIKTIMIMPDAAASFVFSPMTPGPGQTVQFADTTSGDPTSWTWDFGDGATSTSKNPSHIFSKAAFYTVSLISSDGSGSRQASKTVTVASVSVLAASFSYSPASPAVEQAVQFTDTSAGTPTSWQWNFGDGSTSTAQNPSHAFVTAGSKTVTLTATNASGSNSTTRTVTVVTALAASFSYSPASPAVGQAVQFTDTSAGTPTSWQWNFGDGTTITVQNPNHVFTTEGSKTVSLTVANANGSKNTSRTIIVAAALTASFIYAPSSPISGQAVQFTDTSLGSPSLWQWSFGNGVTSSAQNPIHTFTESGSYSISLTVMNAATQNTRTQIINVSTSSNDSHYAASASLADVRAAISSASPGDTVVIPAGNVLWTEQLIIRKGVRLIGAGIGKTVITNGWMTTGWNQGLIYYYPSNPGANEPFRLSGLEFNGNGNGVYKDPNSFDYSQLVVVQNTGQAYLTNIRIDHNKFYNCGKTNWISIIGHVAGVADNNIIGDAIYDANRSVRICHHGGNTSTWTNYTFSYGSAIQWYWEDNTIVDYLMLSNAYYGAKHCFRYNTIYYISQTGFTPMFDVHGDKGGQNLTSSMGTEIYENTIMCTFNVGGTLLDHRGGMAIAYNNSTNQAALIGIQVREEYNDSLSPPATSQDGETQHICRSYYWNNFNYFGTPAASAIIGSTVDYGGNIGTVPQKNRDYWHQTDLFDGTSGMGVGVISVRPISCIVEGAGYWATDENKLYRWHNGRWELYYTPYTYPHPLR